MLNLSVENNGLVLTLKTPEKQNVNPSEQGANMH